VTTALLIEMRQLCCWPWCLCCCYRWQQRRWL